MIIREMQIKTIMRYHLTLLWSEWPSSKSLQTTNTGGDVEKKEPPMLLVGMLIGAVTMENSMEVP